MSFNSTLQIFSKAGIISLFCRHVFHVAAMDTRLEWMDSNELKGLVRFGWVSIKIIRVKLSIAILVYFPSTFHTLLFRYHIPFSNFQSWINVFLGWFWIIRFDLFRFILLRFALVFSLWFRKLKMGRFTGSLIFRTHFGFLR